MKGMRVAVAGTGSIGKRHIGNLQALLPDLRLVLIRDSARIDDYSDELDAEVVSSLDAALHSHLDALVIATPSVLHAQLVDHALASGLSMYIEKPVITRQVQLNQVKARLNECDNNLVTQVGCNLRFLPSLLKLRSLLQGGAIGRIVRATFESGQWLPDWRPHQDHRSSYSALSHEGGGVLLDLIHEVDAARWILGELLPIACQTAQVPILEIETEGAATALLRSSDGALIHIGLDYVSRSPVRRYHFIGEKGSLTWDLSLQQLLLDAPLGKELIDCGHHGFDIKATYYTAMRAFLASIVTGTESAQPLAEGIASAALTLNLKELACQNH